MLDDLLSPMLSSLDAIRGLLLRALRRVVRPFIRSRELRVASAGLLLVVGAWSLTLLTPLWLLALGPILWGVPHILSDIRYLVVRPGLHRRKSWYLPVGIPLLLSGLAIYPVASGVVAAIMVTLLAHGSLWRKGLALLILIPLFAWAVYMGYTALILFAHAHNFIAVMLWWAWRKRDHRLHLMTILAFLAGSAAIALGWVHPLDLGATWLPDGLGHADHLAILAPGLPEALGLRMVLLFAFAQAVHYGVWLRLIPEDDRPSPSPRTFQSTYRALKKDMGTRAIQIAMVLAFVFVAWALLDLAASRANYLRLALFHGHLELAAAAFLFVEGYQPKERRLHPPEE